MSDILRYLGGSTGLLTVGALTASAAAWYMMGNSSSVHVPPIDLNNQSQPVQGYPNARTSCFVKDGKLIDHIYDDVRTAYDLYVRGARISNNGPCVGYRDGDGPYQWISYNDILLRAVHLGSGILHKGLKPINSTRIGMYSQNRVEYVVTELACYTFSMVLVPLYDTLGPDACTYIINQADIELVICDKRDRVQRLLDHKKDTPSLKYIVTIETVEEEDMKRAVAKGVEIIHYSDMEKSGTENEQKPVPASPEDLCVINYTSGTTGDPKGAMISHGNLVAQVSGIYKQMQSMNVTPADVMISYLPMAHSYERSVQSYIYMCGGQVGFFRGNIKTLMDDIKLLRPTIFISVPRLLNRVYDKVMSSVNSSKMKKLLFDMACSSKLRDLERGIISNDTIWDKLVFKKVQQSLGGRVRYIVSGSAPLSSKVLTFLRCASGSVVSEGYGSTENTGVCTVHVEGETEVGHVGPPLACFMVKVVDVPEMDYYAKNQQGEVCVKGPGVFKGYLKQPEKTKESIDEDGWLHTGDIGMWTEKGTLKIIDRKKNIFKLAQGEYIAPDKIENIYIRSPAIAQMYVHGNSFQACLVGIVVPDPDTIFHWVKNNVNVDAASIAEICGNKEVKKSILEDITKLGKKAGLNSFEQVKDIYLYPDLFSVENGLLTPTFKAKRHELQKRFIPEIEEMYRKLS